MCGCHSVLPASPQPLYSGAAGPGPGPRPVEAAVEEAGTAGTGPGVGEGGRVGERSPAVIQRPLRVPRGPSPHRTPHFGVAGPALPQRPLGSRTTCDPADVISLLFTCSLRLTALERVPFPGVLSLFSRPRPLWAALLQLPGSSLAPHLEDSFFLTFGPRLCCTL